jgi:putative ABC transport system permease protein
MWFSTFVFKNVLRRPVRSILTGVGVALAVGAVVSLLGISQGFERSLDELLEGRKVDLVVVRKGVTERLTSSLDEKLGQRIRKLHGVVAVTGGLMDLVTMRKGNTDVPGVAVQGLTADSFMLTDLEIAPPGRKFEAGEGHVAMLGTVLAANLGKGLGDSVEIEGDSFKVIAVFRSFNVYENGSALIPLADLQRLMDRPGQVTGFQVVVNQTTVDKEALIEQIQNEVDGMKDERGRSLNLSALPAHDYVRTTLQIQIAHAMAWTTSAIALVIGTIGMLNTMIMSVFERTREIGILRAIGWRKRRIVGMILGESLVLCTVGAVVGVVGAVVITHWLSTFPSAAGYIRGTIPPAVVGYGFVLALAVGLVGGAYPAYRGASLSPTEAIRHE